MTWFRSRRYRKAFAAVHGRVDRWVRTQDPGLVLCADALEEASALWHAALPANTASMTGIESQRASHAQHVLGWLYCTRYSSLPVDDSWVDLAQALLLLAPFAQSAPETIPGPLLPMVSASADPDIQAGIAAGLLVHLQHRQDPAALAVAIELFTRAVAATAIDHPNRVWWLSDLGVAYLIRFQRAGAAADLDAAIDFSSQAVAVTPTGHRDRTMFQRNLDIAHETRLERAYTPTALDPTMETSSGWVELDHPDRADIAADLDEAIERYLEMIGDHPANPAETLSKLAGTYLTLFQRSGIAAALDIAIDMFTDALLASPVDDTNRDWHFANLGIAYRARFERTGATEDLDVAIELFTSALAANSVISATRARRLSELCIAHHLRFESSGEAIDHDTLRELVDQVQGGVLLVPLMYAHTVARIGRLARAAGEHAVAVEMFRKGVQALPRVARHELERRCQEDRLGGFTGLVSEVIAAHLQVNDVPGAIEMAELGRGVLLSAQLDARTDLTELRRVRPDLAERFEALQDDLTVAPLTPSDGGSSVETTAHLGRVRVTRGWLRDIDWHGLMNDIRALGGFEHFLGPPRWSDLAQAALGGSVVLINAGPCRADAILLRSGTAAPVAVELDDLTLADVRSHAVSLLRACADGAEGPADLEQVVPDVLAWLWESVAEPVLTALGHTRPPSPNEPWPRLWWVPTGPLGLFPLHAAGLPAGESALDRVISSYTPTIRALVAARRRPVGAHRHLTVAMQHTHGHADLPGTVAEAAVLQARYPGAALLTDHEATADRVLAALRDGTWAHFACHTVSDPTTPSRSSLLLHDRPLPLPDIARLEVRDAELAYLSACSTAQTSLHIPDEAIHLASAFQLAGYRHVIATLWPLDDAAAAHAAQRFYQLLPDPPDAGTAATILHQLTRELRELHPDQPAMWAPFIHSGP